MSAKTAKLAGTAALAVGLLAASSYDVSAQSFSRVFDGPSGFNSNFFGLPGGTNLSGASISNVSSGCGNVTASGSNIIARPGAPGDCSFTADVGGQTYNVSGTFQGDLNMPEPPQPGSTSFMRNFSGPSRFTLDRILQGINPNNFASLGGIVGISGVMGGTAKIGSDGSVIAMPSGVGPFSFTVTFANGVTRLVSGNFATPS